MGQRSRTWRRRCGERAGSTVIDSRSHRSLRVFLRMLYLKSSTLPSSVATNAKFIAQLAEARRLRAAEHDTGHALDGNFGHVLNLEGPEWSAAREALAGTLRDALDLRRPIDLLHGALPRFSPRPDAHERVMAAKTRLLRPLADAAIAAPFLQAYEAMMLDVVAPHVSACYALEGQQCDRLYYAAFPTLRVQTPSASHATIRPHFDGMYDLPLGSLNFWIPLTRVSEASALWLEGATGVGEIVDEIGGEIGVEIGGAAEGPRSPYARAPHYLALTDASRFDGRSTIHFTVPNRSTRTRVSIDFRVVPGARFDPSCRLARLGYFSVCERHVERHGERHVERVSRGAVGPRDGRRDDDDDGARSGKFRKVASGRVSKLHGMPHEAKPVVLDGR